MTGRELALNQGAYLRPFCLMVFSPDMAGSLSYASARGLG